MFIAEGINDVAGNASDGTPTSSRTHDSAVLKH
jgi:hypothetical protein